MNVINDPTVTFDPTYALRANEYKTWIPKFESTAQHFGFMERQIKEMRKLQMVQSRQTKYDLLEYFYNTDSKHFISGQGSNLRFFKTLRLRAIEEEAASTTSDTSTVSVIQLGPSGIRFNRHVSDASAPEDDEGISSTSSTPRESLSLDYNHLGCFIQPMQYASPSNRQ